MSIHPYTRLFILPSAPTVDEDDSEGYEIGDVVISGGSIYDCTDNTTGAAVWIVRGTAETPSPPEEQILYVGKHGDDGNDGTSIEAAFLTFGAALSAASALTPSDTNRFTIVCHDGGIYTETLTGVQYVSIFAPGAILAGTIDVQGDMVVHLFKVVATANGQELIDKRQANTSSFVHVDECDGRGFNNVTNFRNAPNNGILFVDVGKVWVGANGLGFGDQSGGTIGHIHIKHCGDLYLAGNNAVGMACDADKIVGYVDHILETGSPTGTTGITVGATGEVYITLNELIADTAWDVTSGGSLKGFVGNTSGTQTGTAYMVSPNQDMGGDLGGTHPNPLVLKSSTTFAFTGVITPSLSVDTNDWNPTGLSTANVVQVSVGGGGCSVTGIAGGFAGRVLIIETGTSDPLTLVASSSSSSAINRFDMSQDIDISSGECVILKHNGTSWRVIGSYFPKVSGGNSHDHSGGDGAPIKMLLPWGVYVSINPLTTTGDSPFATTIDRNMTLTQWGQMVFVLTTNNGSNYWTIEIKRITDNALVNSINTSSGVSPNTATLLTDTTFSIANLTASDVGLYMVCTKTGAPGNLYLFGPALEFMAT